MGYGSIRLFKDDKGVLMRPTISVGDYEFLQCPTGNGEYTCDNRFVYHVDVCHIKIPVDILTIPDA